MIAQDELPRVLDHPLYDRDGRKVGDVKHIFYDEETNRPEWLCVSTGLFGMNETFVPLQEARLVEDHVEVPYDKSLIKDAPNADVEAGRLSPEQERELYRYYHLSPGTTGREGAEGGRGRAGETAEVTRSEERLRAGTQERESGRARLRKYVVTEQQQMNVPVSHEEVRVEREPIPETTTGGRTAAEGEFTESEQEMTLHEERPTVTKESVPKERVRMTKERVTGEETVSEEVRKERVDVESDPATRERDRTRRDR